MAESDTHVAPIQRYDGDVSHRLPPRPVRRVMNAVMKTWLRSPWHQALSGSLMILTMRGRRTGKRITIPVGYVRDGDVLRSFTIAAWQRNLLTPAPVMVRLAGEVRQGTAQTVTDIESVVDGARMFIERYGVQNAPRIGLPPLETVTSGAMPSNALLADIIQRQGRVMIVTTLTSAGPH